MRSEDWFTTADNTRLRSFTWSAAAPKRARLLIVHGLGENAARYGPIAEIFAAAGIKVMAYDHRGHGESAGKRGDLNPPSLLNRDLAEILNRAAKDPTPLFLWGHSTGAQLIINTLSTNTFHLRGVILTAPWFRLALTPPKRKQIAASLLLRFAPGITLTSGVDPADLSRDVEYLRMLPANDRNHNRISARVYDYLVRGGRLAQSQAKNWTIPLLLAHGTADTVTIIGASQEFFQNVPDSIDKTFESFPDGRHELQNDLCRDRLATLIMNWITHRS
ncbi:MAG TPA: lysophospholipase [Chthoniobacterales bacterium]